MNLPVVLFSIVLLASTGDKVSEDVDADADADADTDTDASDCEPTEFVTGADFEGAPEYGYHTYFCE